MSPDTIVTASESGIIASQNPDRTVAILVERLNIVGLKLDMMVRGSRQRPGDCSQEEFALLALLREVDKEFEDVYGALNNRLRELGLLPESGPLLECFPDEIQEALPAEDAT